MRNLFSSRAALLALAFAPLAAATPLPAAAAPAATIPEFDIVQRCDGAILVAGCIEKEHAALATLRYWWRRLDPVTTTACLSDARTDAVLNYSHLLNCLARRGHLPEIALASARGDARDTEWPGGL